MTTLLTWRCASVFKLCLVAFVVPALSACNGIASGTDGGSGGGAAGGVGGGAGGGVAGGAAGGVGGGTGGGSQLLPPAGLRYATNPAIYRLNQAITANTPSHTGGAVTTWSVAPALPPGLTLAPGTGVITGTPTALAPLASFQVTATNAAGNATVALNLEVVDVAPTGLSYSTNPATYLIQQPIAPNTPTSSGGPVLGYSVAPALPAGLSLNATTGVITGTPTSVAPRTSYTLTASNSGGVASATLSLAVNDVPPTNLVYSPTTLTCYLGASCALPAPTSSGGAIENFSVAPQLPAGLYVNTLTGALAGTATASSPPTMYTVTATNSGGSTTAAFTLDTFGRVTTCAELQAIPAATTSTWALLNDIDCAGVAFTPLQDFRGTLDGRHHLIKNLSLEAVATDVGLIAKATGATVQDLGVVGAVVNAQALHAGVLLGWQSQTVVRRCFATGVISHLRYNQGNVTFTGGLVGYIASTLPSTLEDSFSRVIVHGGNDYTGGLVGVVDSGGPHVVQRSYAATEAVTADPWGSYSGRTGALLTYTWSTVTDAFGLAQPGVPFALGTTTGTFSGNIGLVASAMNDAGVITDLQGTALASHAPFTSWDFANTWQETSGFPTLRGFTYPANFATALSYTPATQYVVPGQPLTAMRPQLTDGATLSGCTIAPAVPSGLNFDPGTCVLSGTPTQPLLANSSWLVTASTSVGPLTARLVLMPQPPSTLVYPGAPFTFDVTNGAITPIVPTHTGGLIVSCIATAYSSSTSPTPLPAGLSLDPTTCTLQGTPTARSPTTTYSILARGPAGDTRADVSITVLDPRPTITYAASFALIQQVPLLPIEPATRFNVVSVSIAPTLPAGLSLDTTTGAVSGTPTALSASTNYTVTALNLAGQSTTATFSLQVTAPGTITPVFTDLDADSTGALAVGASNTNVAVQRFDAQGAALGSPTLVLQTTSNLNVGPWVSRSANGSYAVAASQSTSTTTAARRWAILQVAANGTPGPLSWVDGVDSFADLAIDSAGLIAFVATTQTTGNSYRYGLVLIGPNGVLPGFPFDPAACTTSMGAFGVHVALSGSMGIVTCQAHSGDPIAFRRFSYSATTFTWLELVPPTVSTSSSWYDSHFVGMASDGSFVVGWSNYSGQRDEATFYDATGVATNHVTFPTGVGAWDTVRGQHVQVQVVGTDFVVPFNDPANGPLHFNSYGRFTSVGVSKGSASGAGYDTSTLVVTPGSTWVVSQGAVVHNPFTLLP